jgi:subtilase family serine protease
MCYLGSLQAHSCATISLLTLPLAATNVENAVKVIGDNTDPNYTNNVQTTLVTVRGQTAADLECTVSGTRNCADVQYTKCGMRAVITVKNRGSASAQRCRVRVYLSHDTVLDNGDLLIKEFYCGSLRPGRTRTKTFHMKMPVEYCGTVIFDRYLICIVDVDDVVKETDESNNVGVGEPIS